MGCLRSQTPKPLSYVYRKISLLVSLSLAILRCILALRLMKAAPMNNSHWISYHRCQCAVPI